ncbi:hypothetical protein RJ640_011155 [Escallonia rubra]|uniref:Phosphatidic acid phosphatase type 2/haloperoxidase domain-containing protein n=1 Tax=Escallonia rubra TaxID=112253 RepID=A0AA88TYT0_9ASTE|nr:hypothetical protein RJ640_011155 [Escallonia rubra]
MSPATAIFNGPTTILTLSSKLVSCSAYPTSKLVYFRKNFVNRSWCIDTITESVKTRELKGSSRDEGVRAFEQEVLMDGSSEFRPSVVVATGLESTLNRLSKWLVAALFSTAILWRHDAEALWAASGSVLNAGLSNTLKQIVNQERPVSTLGSGPGMPSSHAQSIFFAVVFVIVSMVEWLGLNGLTVALTGLLLALGSYLIKNSYHHL